MLQSFVSASSSARSTAKRALIGVALVVIGYVAALLGPAPSVAIPSGPGGNASDGSAAAQPASHSTSPPGAASTGRMQEAFDYFPDHYTNQAGEVADQASTF
jgi:hypothetical protein